VTIAAQGAPILDRRPQLGLVNTTKKTEGPVTLRTRKPPRSVTPESTSASVLDDLIDLHFSGDEPPILDASGGRGGIWKGARHRPTISLDKRPLPGIDVVGRWENLPELFGPSAFYAIVWDPPQPGGRRRARPRR
jgi:hypothetical protein